MNYDPVGAKKKDVEFQFDRNRDYHSVATVYFVASTVTLSVLGAQRHYWTATCLVSADRSPSRLPPSVVESNDAALPLHASPAVFLGLAFLTHFVCSVWWKSWYREKAREGRGWVCWAEYTFSASIMNVAIASLCGVCSILELSSIATLTAVTMWFGAIAEYLSSLGKTKSSLYAFLFGCVPFAMAWAIISVPFARAHAEVPQFVVVIFVTMVVCETLFAVNMIWFIIRRSEFSGESANLMNSAAFGALVGAYERNKIVASVIAKTLLAWLLYGGVFAAAP